MIKKLTITILALVTSVATLNFDRLQAGFSTRSSPSSESTDFSPSHEPVVIYMEKDKHKKTNIMRNTGVNKQEKLATFDGKPRGYTMSPQKDSLAVYSDKKLDLLDLNTKRYSETIRPKQQICGANYSPDGKHLMVWDQKCRSGRQNNYYVHDYDINNRRDNIVYQSQSLPTKNYFYPYAWRPDNNLVLLEMTSSNQAVWLFDMANKTFKQTEYRNPIWISPDGQYMACANKNSFWNRNDFYSPYSWQDDMSSRPYKDRYQIFDPLTNNNFGTYGDDNTYNSIVGYSPYQNELMYESSSRYNTQGQYYTSTFNGQPRTVSNPYSQLINWNYGNIGAEVGHKYGNYVIVIGNLILVTANNPLGLISQYYNDQQFSPNEYPNYQKGYQGNYGSGRTKNVNMRNSKYYPSTISVRVGDRITWTNKDTIEHTVTNSQYGFDSGILSPGQTYTMTVTQSGEFTYFCRIHPEMTGRIRIRDTATINTTPPNLPRNWMDNLRLKVDPYDN